jgi:hypothetical protein
MASSCCACFVIFLLHLAAFQGTMTHMAPDVMLLGKL